ncbi:MAG: hypothetical protein RIQ64_1572 [Actinomycetota bacterium]|jgi:peptidoglycan hydrolase-like protein with peptidoglycan-binding domain
MKKGMIVGGVLIVAVVGGAFVVGQRSNNDASVATPLQKYTLVTVEKRDLATTADVSGTIGYGDTRSIALSDPTGTITALPQVGTIIERGDALVEVDGQPTPWLLYGERPVWRNFNSYMTDGPDVKQLEENLVALGVTDLVPDESFDADTTTAIKAWQEKLDVTADGVLAASEVVFSPGAVRVSGYSSSVGSSASGNVLLVTDTDTVVSVSLNTSKASLAQDGASVTVTMADGTEMTGKITSIAAEASSSSSNQSGSGGNQSSQGSTTLAVKIILDKPVTANDGTSVTVQLASSTAKDVIAVPVKSLVALVEGGFAVERVRSGGDRTLVAVTPGVFASGWVEVAGDVQVGDQVVVPA